MATKGWIRVSTDKQDYENQRHAILEYANKNQRFITQWYEFVISTRKQNLQKNLDDMIASMEPGDEIIVAELSRLGRSMRQMLNLIYELHEKRKVTVIAIKENIVLSGEETTSIRDKMLITIFAMLFEIERDFISLRTKDALTALKARGVQLGRHKGIGKSKLDGKEESIKELLGKGINKSAIAQIFGVSRTNMIHFIKTRKLDTKKRTTKQ